MLTEVTDQQKKSYAENGFLVVENFLDPAELEEWRAAVDHDHHAGIRPPSRRRAVR